MVRLLIIDNDLATCDFLKSFFTQKGYETFVANDGEQGLFIVKEKKPDIILLDIKMPGFSGLEVLQKIKEIDKNAKVIMMTAVNEGFIIEMAMKYGAIDYITKPFSLEWLEKDVLLKTLEKIL